MAEVGVAPVAAAPRPAPAGPVIATNPLAVVQVTEVDRFEVLDVSLSAGAAALKIVHHNLDEMGGAVDGGDQKEHEGERGDHRDEPEQVNVGGDGAVGPVVDAVDRHARRIGEHEIRRQLLVLSPKPVSAPGTERRPARLDIARIQGSHPGPVIVPAGAHRTDGGAVVSGCKPAWGGTDVKGLWPGCILLPCPCAAGAGPSPAPTRRKGSASGLPTDGLSIDREI